MTDQSNNKNGACDSDVDFALWIDKHWWILILSLFSFFAGILIPHFVENATIKLICEIVARIFEAVLIGGLFTFFSSYKPIVAAYRKELKKMLTEPEYFKLRSDINEIWIKVSEVILNTKFTEIGDDLLSIIKQKYMKTDDDIRCYSNYDATIILSWPSEKDRNWVIIDESSNFCICVETNGEVVLSQNNSVSASGPNDGTFSEMELIWGNKKEYATGVYNDLEKKFECEASIKLQGRNQYDIVKKANRKMALGGDDFIGFKAKYITQNMSLKISHPKDMKITMAETGTIGKFDRKNINEKTCEFKYKGLILPKQGYTIYISAI